MPDQGWDQMVIVGRIARPQGIRGEVIIDASTDFPDERFGEGQSVIVRRGAEAETLTVAEFRMHGGRPVVRFDGTASMDDAEKLRGLEMRVPEASLAALPEGMWYHHELLGCRVRTKDGRDVGTVISIQGPTERSILEVDGPGGLALIPLAAEFVTVHRDEKLVEIDPPEGLLEVNRGGKWRGQTPPDDDDAG